MERGRRNLKETDSSPFFRLCTGQKMMRAMPFYNGVQPGGGRSSLSLELVTLHRLNLLNFLIHQEVIT